MSIPGAGGSRSAAAAGEPGIKSDSTEYTSSPPPNDEVINTTELAARESDQPNARVDMPVMGDRQRAANSLCGLCRGEYSGPAESERAAKGSAARGTRGEMSAVVSRGPSARARGGNIRGRQLGGDRRPTPAGRPTRLPLFRRVALSIARLAAEPERTSREGVSVSIG